ncbi:ATP-binding protein [Actinoplanes sp. NPDC051346]|uniref:sensor histidine kinase n=1 Tax=Actinoplanes sp. NPDC051346 TaxID=3155048 RepID=UPI00344424A8
MTSAPPRAGRPGFSRVAGAVRDQLDDPILRRVVAVTLLGMGLAAAVVVAPPGDGSVLRGLGVPTAWLLPGLTVLSCLAELTVVRLRHGEAVEELTLYEAALVIDVLLLPPRDALVAAAAGLVLASALQRRPVTKAVFNVGTYTAAAAVLIFIVHLVGGSPGLMTPGVLLGVITGTLAFTGVNLCCLAQILGVINGLSPWRIVRSEARLSGYMAVGTMATGLLTAEIALHAPLLLPFMAMPALAVTYAYRAAAREAEERARSTSLLQLSHALAEREDVVRQFLLLVREAFGADLGVVWLENDVALSVEAKEPATVRHGPVPRYLAALGQVDAPVQLVEELPPGLRRMIVVPVQGGGRRLGTAAFAISGRDRGWMTTGDVTLLASLASALAVAMVGAEHFARLVDETSKLQAVVEQSTEGIMVIEGDGLIRMWSRALADITGVDAAEAAGRPLAEVLDVPAEEERPLLMPASEEQPRAVVELTVSRRDGEQRRLRFAHSAIFTAGTVGRDVVVVSDLTREYRTERLKSDFIAMVSHELRTPLTPIIGYVDLLRSRGERMTPQKRLDALNLIGDRAGHLSRLVEDLLLASRFGDNPDDVSLHVSAATHDLCALVNQAARDLGSTRIDVEIPAEPVLVHCDDGRTLQVLANLIGNGLKYSGEDTRVEVSMRLEDSRVHVDVRDHGRGIPADQLEKIFDKFHRVEDPMTMATSGTGLGLFIARRLARAMDGDISVVSTLNSGSVFTLSLAYGQPTA